MTSGVARSGSDAAVLDLRTYRLVPSGRDDFDRIFREGAFPMLRRAGIQVAGYGPSLADQHHYFVARAFPSAAERERQLGTFYGSDEWRQNYEHTAMGLIESYHVVVIPLPESTHAAVTSTPLFPDSI
jgi:hypothetical protein